MILILNSLHFGHIVLAFAFQILFIRFFGASIETDSYYTVLGLLQLVNLTTASFLVDLYTPIYHETKAKDPLESCKFTNSVITFSCCVAIVVVIVIYFFSSYFVNFFASGFDAQTKKLSTGILNIWCITIVFEILFVILNEHLAAQLIIKHRYILNLLTPLINILALLFFCNSFGFKAIVFAYLIANSLKFLIVAFIFSKHHSFRPTNPFRNLHFKRLIKGNTPIYIAKSISNIAAIINSNILSYFPPGFITLYRYVENIFRHISTLVQSPLIRILYSKSSEYISTNKLNELYELLRNTIFNNITILGIAIVTNVIYFEPLYYFLFASKLTTQQINTMYYLFIAYIPFSIAYSLEIPFIKLTQVLQKTMGILYTSLLFLTFYIPILALTIPFLGIYSLPTTLFFTEIFITGNYIRIVKKHLELNYLALFVPVTYSAIYLVFIICIKEFIKLFPMHNNLYTLSLLFLFFLILEYKRIRIVLKYILGNYFEIR